METTLPDAHLQQLCLCGSGLAADNCCWAPKQLRFAQFTQIRQADFMAMAQRAHLRGKLSTAYSAYTTILGAQPDNTEALYHLGLLSNKTTSVYTLTIVWTWTH